MSGEIKFEETGSKIDMEKIYGQRPGFGGKLAGFLIKVSGGIIKTEKQANYIILAIAVIIFIISIFIFVGTFNKVPKIK